MDVSRGQTRAVRPDDDHLTVSFGKTGCKRILHTFPKVLTLLHKNGNGTGWIQPIEIPRKVRGLNADEPVDRLHQAQGIDAVCKKTQVQIINGLRIEKRVEAGLHLSHHRIAGKKNQGVVVSLFHEIALQKGPALRHKSGRHKWFDSQSRTS